MKIIPYGRQNITQQDIDAVVDALQSDFLTQGPRILEFEQKFASYVNSKYAVAVANGTAALHLSALALGVNSKSKVITTPITFAASANCIRYCEGAVAFADIDPATALLDINKVRSLLKASPKGTYQGIIPVDFGGYPVDLEAFRELADEYGLWIIEDACHAPGGYFIDSKGVKQYCGNGVYADLAIFSFHPVKHIACGEGGMITTNSKELYEKLLVLRTHGISKDPKQMTENHGGWYYEMIELGYNYRLTDIQCALGITQLAQADAGLIRRKEIAKKYDEAFSNSSARAILPTEKASHAYHLYIIEVANRKKLYDVLREKGIYAQIHYVPVHTMPYYQKLGHKKGSMASAESYYSKCISLPMYPTLTNDEQDYVIKAVKEFFERELMIPELESERLFYKALSLEHCTDKYVSWLNNPEVYKYLETGGNYSLKMLKEYLASVETNSNMLFWAIHLKHNNEHIGNIKIDPVNKRHSLGEYGILMGEQSEWGKGYAKEASKLILRYCFETLNLRKITLGVVERNNSAVQLYKSIGFEIEGVYKKHGLYGNEYLDVLRMALFNPNFRNT